MVKAAGFKNTYLKKGLWSPEEDRKLIACVRGNGILNWNETPKAAGLLRCGKSCRLRWVNYLSPDVKRGNFSQEEDQTIIKLHELLGNRWSAIASTLPGRTDNEIKNHWHGCLKKRFTRNEVSITTSVQGTQPDIIVEPNQNNPPEADLLLPSNAPKELDFDGCKSTPTFPQISIYNLSSSSSCGSAGEIYKKQTLEDQNNGFSERYGEFQSCWEQPFTMDGLCVMDEYGETCTTKPLQGTQTAIIVGANHINPPESDLLIPLDNGPKASAFDGFKATPASPLLSADNLSSPSSSTSDEIYKNLTLEDQNISCSTKTYGKLRSFGEDPFIVEGLCTMDGYGETDTDPGFMVSTPQWRLLCDTSPSASYYDANDDSWPSF